MPSCHAATFFSVSPVILSLIGTVAVVLDFFWVGLAEGTVTENGASSENLSSGRELSFPVSGRIGVFQEMCKQKLISIIRI